MLRSESTAGERDSGTAAASPDEHIEQEENSSKLLSSNIHMNFHMESTNNRDGTISSGKGNGERNTLKSAHPHILRRGESGCCCLSVFPGVRRPRAYATGLCVPLCMCVVFCVFVYVCLCELIVVFFFVLIARWPLRD